MYKARVLEVGKGKGVVRFDHFFYGFFGPSTPKLFIKDYSLINIILKDYPLLPFVFAFLKVINSECTLDKLQKLRLVILQSMQNILWISYHCQQQS